MRLIEKLPLPLDTIAADLNELELDALVTSAKVEYDERKIGTDVELILTVRITDIYKERKTEEEKYDDAMGIL